MGGFTNIRPIDGGASQSAPPQATPLASTEFTNVRPLPPDDSTSVDATPQAKPIDPIRAKMPLYLGGKGILGGLQDKILDYVDKRTASKMSEANVDPKSAEQHAGNLYGMLNEMPDTAGHAAADVVGIAGSMAEHPVQTVASMLPVSRLAMLPVFGWQGIKMLKQPRGKDESGIDYLQRMLLAGSMVTGAAGGLGKAAPKDFQTIAHSPQTFIDTIKAARETFPRSTIVTATNETLQKSRGGLLATLEDSSKQANAKIGTMVKDIVTKDKQTAPSGIFPTGGVAHAVAQVKGSLNVPDSLLPKTNYIGELVNQFGRKSGPMLSFENLKDIRGEIGEQMQDATGKDYAAMSQLYKGFTNMMSSRAKQLGLGDAFDSYTELTKKLSDVRSGILKNLQNDASGVSFFKTLGDPKIRPQVRSMLDVLEQHGGLPKGAVEALVEQHKPLTTLAEISGRGTGGVGGRLSAVTRHPLVAGTAFALATKFAPISPFIMSLFAAQGAADVADQFAAARAKIGLSRATPISLSQPTAGPAGMSPPAPQGPPAAPQGPPPVQGLPGPVGTQAPAQAPQLAMPLAAAQTAQAAPPVVQAPAAAIMPPAVAPVQQPMPPATTVQPTAPKVVAPKAPATAKAPARAYSEFGITLDPTTWKTPEDVINAKKQALSQLTEAARTKATAINEAAKGGVIKAAERDSQLKSLADKILKANRSIEKEKSPQIGSGARDRLRKGAEAFEANRVEGEAQAHKEVSIGHAAEDALIKVDKLSMALRASGHEKVTKLVEREWRKQGGKDADPAELALMLETAFNKLMEKK